MRSPKQGGHHRLPVYRSSIIGHTKRVGRVLHGKQDAGNLLQAAVQAAFHLQPLANNNPFHLVGGS